jgi:hypothetical protein
MSSHCGTFYRKCANTCPNVMYLQCCQRTHINATLHLVLVPIILLLFEVLFISLFQEYNFVVWLIKNVLNMYCLNVSFKVKNNVMFQAAFFLGRVEKYKSKNWIVPWGAVNFKIGIQLYKSPKDAHVTEFILSDNYSTCFGLYYHPSSGVQTTVTTASGNRYTILLSAAIVEELELIC